ncbi:trichohyalin-like isoform X1 [Gouania willdenowi]|uniref:trichohyalin-like isoform X1 n=1 Tax=Gouania willdenowi TaxID=441366 RepID=UPI0010547E40|nr:trichohyalin-like isoform X1 [Gouania willdenowi]XP_028304076.1 trichohyalin-like isoform X1 [Gouania willdenowi]
MAFCKRHYEPYRFRMDRANHYIQDKEKTTKSSKNLPGKDPLLRPKCKQTDLVRQQREAKREMQRKEGEEKLKQSKACQLKYKEKQHLKKKPHHEEKSMKPACQQNVVTQVDKKSEQKKKKMSPYIITIEEICQLPDKYNGTTGELIMGQGEETFEEESKKTEEQGKESVDDASVIRNIDEERSMTEEELEILARHQDFIMQKELKEFEQDKRVQNINQQITALKLQSDLVDQIFEKEKIQAEKMEEKARLDKLKGCDTGKDGRITGQRHRQNCTENAKYIKTQIEERKKQVQIEEDRKKSCEKEYAEMDQECIQSHLMAREAKKAETKWNAQQNLLLTREKKRAKKEALEGEIQESLQIKDWINKKDSQQAEIAAKKQKLKQLRQIPVDLVSDQLKRINKNMKQDHEAEFKRLKRIKDDEWKRKQKVLAENKANKIKSLQKGLAQQLETKAQCRVTELAHQRKQQENDVKELQAHLAKQKQEDEKRRQDLLTHKELLKKQVKQQESLKKQKLNEELNNEKKLLNRQKLKSNRIDEYIADKNKEYVEIRNQENLLRFRTGSHYHPSLANKPGENKSDGKVVLPPIGPIRQQKKRLVLPTTPDRLPTQSFLPPIAPKKGKQTTNYAYYQQVTIGKRNTASPSSSQL